MIFWDIKAVLYTYFRRLWPFSLILDQENAHVVKLLSHINLRNKLILDIGCGTGNVVELLPRRMRTIGSDVSLEMLKRTRRYLLIPVIQGDANFLPFKNGIADVAISVGVLEYQPDCNHFLQELISATKIDGYLLVTSTPPGVLTWFRRLLGIPLKTTLPEQVIEGARKQGVILIEQTHSLMQDQYLFQKIQVV